MGYPCARARYPRSPCRSGAPVPVIRGYARTPASRSSERVTELGHRALGRQALPAPRSPRKWESSAPCAARCSAPPRKRASGAATRSSRLDATSVVATVRPYCTRAHCLYVHLPFRLTLPLATCVNVPPLPLCGRPLYYNGLECTPDHGQPDPTNAI